MKKLVYSVFFTLLAAVAVAQQPAFTPFPGGGMTALKGWIKANMADVPAGMPENRRDTVALHFKIEPDGSLSDIRVVEYYEGPLSGRVVIMLESVAGFDTKTIKNYPERKWGDLHLEFSRNGIREFEPFATDRMPRFKKKGNVEDFRRWVVGQITYPEEAQRGWISGRVVVVFAVEKDGSVTIDEILQAPSESLVSEVVRIVLKSPKWTPGTQYGRAVRVRYTLPVDFTPPQPADSGTDF